MNTSILPVSRREGPSSSSIYFSASFRASSEITTSCSFLFFSSSIGYLFRSNDIAKSSKENISTETLFQLSVEFDHLSLQSHLSRSFCLGQSIPALHLSPSE